ncbi:hypothetical protein FS837_009631 [Tulasnella sp. UAMH 9824]|nr:hypothetical protein FS837_009631 [Tulasnella sp. UAMH 9824]
MAPKLVSSETVFDLAKFAASLGPVPGLGAGVLIIEKIYKSAKNVKINRGKCTRLGDAAVVMMETIRDNAPTAEPTKLDKTIQNALSTLENIKQDVDLWSSYKYHQSFYRRHEIEDSIQKHSESMSECLNLLGVAAALQINKVVLALQKGREEDTNKLDKILQDNAIMRQAQAELLDIMRVSPLQSLERARASNFLLQLRRDEIDLGKVGALPPELQLECVKDSLLWAGPRCDIWKGLRLGHEIVTLKFYRGFKRPGDQIKDMERFERQVDIWRKLIHPNILTLYGWCYIGRDICLVTPWLENQDARKYLAKENVSDEHKLQIAIEIAQGLQYLHGRGFLHADVEPSNVLIDEGGHAKLGDFTLAKALDSNERVGPTSQSSCDLASLRYQPPEVMRDEDITIGADIWSWAMTFLEIASGAYKRAPATQPNPHYLGTSTGGLPIHAFHQLSPTLGSPEQLLEPGPCGATLGSGSPPVTQPPEEPRTYE